MRGRSSYLLGSALVGTGIIIGAWMVIPEEGVRAFGSAVHELVSAKEARAQEGKPELSPTQVSMRPRDTYYPNTEDLAPDEMRVIACGTGMPTTRMKQAAACFLVELGNGDKFLFDAGTGSAERISALQIPYNYLDKMFIGHLHSDHFGAVPEYWIGGALMGRNQPLRIWGPSGRIPELGTAAAMDAMQKMFLWDITGRVGNVDPRGYKLEVHEFDYKGENQVVYDENGVVIRSFPAVHAIDGAVSYSLEWNGLKFVFGSDTFPNQWFNKYAQDADIAIHECFIAVPDIVKKLGFTPESALLVGTQIHTAPEAFGKVMSEVKPRMAVAYHFFKDFDTTAQVYNRIRKTYEGPLSLAEDFMVWNVTKDGIRERMAVVEESTWSPPTTRPNIAPSKDDRAKFAKLKGLPVEAIGYSDFIANGKWNVDEVLRPIYAEASNAVGREFVYPADEK